MLLFFLPSGKGKGEKTLSWKEGVEGIDWGTLMLFGGGLSMGAMMFSTGLSQWMGEAMKGIMGGHPSEFFFIAVFCVMSLLLSEFASHTAAVNLMGTIAIGTALSLGFNPIPVAVGVAMASSRRSSAAAHVSAPCRLLRRLQPRRATGEQPRACRWCTL